MVGFNGGLIGKTRNTSNSQSLPGVWTSGEQVVARRGGLWPLIITVIPSTITTSLWLDALDTSSVVLTSNAVSQWSDKSGNNRHATQNTAGQRPTVNPAGINNRPAINFDGSDDCLFLPTGFLNGTTAFTVAMVISGPLQNNDGIFAPSNTYSVGLEINYTQQISQPTLLRINNNTRITTGLWSTNSTPTLTTITASSTATAGWLNGSPVSAVSSAGNSALNFNGIYALGRVWQTGYNAQMAMGEFIIIESSVSTNVRQSLEGYLAFKWGLESLLPNDHPFKSSPP